jgi:O-methyltransferase involved in polyketide biosynthesis
MPETTQYTLSGVPETYLAPLYWRAMESQRPDAMIIDQNAVALITQLEADAPARLDSSGVRQIPINELLTAMRIIFTRELDRFAQDFLGRHPDAVVAHIGCGLDTRFERVCSEPPDNGQVEWYDLDLPDVIDLRRALIGGEGGRYHLLAGSVLEEAWLEAVGPHRQRPFLFLAEGVFMYFTEAQVKSLVLRLKEHFPAAELVFDAYSPFMRLAHNLRVIRKRVGAHLNWDLKHSQDLEGWGAGIRLLDERFPFQFPEVDQRRALRVRLFSPLVARGIGVFHYRV